MPQAVSSDILEPGGRLRPKSGKRTRLKWIDQAPAQQGVTAPMPGRPVGALAEYGLPSESDEDDEQDGSTPTPPPLVEIARTMSTVFDVRKHPTAGSKRANPKTQEPASTVKAAGPTGADSAGGPRAGLSPVTIPPLDMGRVEGTAGPATSGSTGSSVASSATSNADDAALQSEDSPAASPNGGGHLIGGSTWARPTRVSNTDDQGKKPAQGDRQGAEKQRLLGASLPAPVDTDVDEPDDVAMLPSPDGLPSGAAAAERPSSAPEGATRGDEMPSLLDLLDQPPGASPTGGKDSASKTNAGTQNSQTEALEDFSPAVRDRPNDEEPTIGGADGINARSLGVAASTDGQHSKVRGRLTESIEDGRSIDARALSGNSGNTLFRHTPASQRIQQQRDTPATSVADTSQTDDADLSGDSEQAGSDKIQQEQAMVAQYKAFRQQQQQQQQQQQRAAQQQQQQQQQQQRAGSGRNGFFGGGEQETSSASMRSRLERPTSPVRRFSALACLVPMHTSDSFNSVAT